MDKAVHIEHKVEDISASNMAAITILLVEDDRTHRTLMEKILKECGFHTCSAENGIVALSKIDAGKHFDLIIMDCDMPEMDGLETTKTIRAREVKKRKPPIPIIAFTANRDFGDREKCLAAGMDAYLPKDIWMPRWRKSLVRSVQGLMTGNFDTQDFDKLLNDLPRETIEAEFDLDDFDEDAFERAASLLKDETDIAIEEYLEDAVAYMKDIERGLNERNFGTILHGSHPLNSNSRGFGLVAVSKLAEAINNTAAEVADEASKLQKVEALLSKLKDAFTRGEKKLKYMRQINI